MNLDLDVLRSALNANKLSVAYSQGKLLAGWAALLLLLQKEQLGAWWNRRRDCAPRRNSFGYRKCHRTLGRRSRASRVEVVSRLCLRTNARLDMLNVHLSLCLLFLFLYFLRSFNVSFVNFFRSPFYLSLLIRIANASLPLLESKKAFDVVTLHRPSLLSSRDSRYADAH